MKNCFTKRKLLEQKINYNNAKTTEQVQYFLQFKQPTTYEIVFHILKWHTAITSVLIENAKLTPCLAYAAASVGNITILRKFKHLPKNTLSVAVEYAEDDVVKYLVKTRGVNTISQKAYDAAWDSVYYLVLKYVQQGKIQINAKPEN